MDESAKTSGTLTLTPEQEQAVLKASEAGWQALTALEAQHCKTVIMTIAKALRIKRGLLIRERLASS